MMTSVRPASTPQAETRSYSPKVSEESKHEPI